MIMTPLLEELMMQEKTKGEAWNINLIEIGQRQKHKKRLYLK